MGTGRWVLLALPAWVGVWAFWLVTTRQFHPTLTPAVVVTTALVTAYALAAAINHLLLVPRLWRERRYGLYAGSLAVTMTLLTGTALAVIRVSYVTMVGPDPDPNGAYVHFAIDLFGMAVHLAAAGGVVWAVGRLGRLRRPPGREGNELSEPLTVRPAVLADLPDLCRFSEELVRQHVAYDPGRYQPPADLVSAYTDLFTDHIGRPDAVVLVAHRAGGLVGYVFGVVEPPCLVELAGRVGWIHDLYVAPQACGSGVGGRLLDEAVAGLRRIGCPGGVSLGVAAQNTAAAAPR